jgi:serine/threonine protein kinase
MSQISSWETSDVQRDTNEYIDSLKYKVEWYTDVIHGYGYTVAHEFFVGHPYNIRIMCKIVNKMYNTYDISQTNNYYDAKEEILSICHCTVPMNKEDTQTYPVKISKKWIENCIKIMKMELEIKEMKEILISNKPNEITLFEIFDNNFTLGIDSLIDGTDRSFVKYSGECSKNEETSMNEMKENQLKAIEYFNKCHIIDKKNICVLYHLACCYIDIDNIKALEYLELCAQYGYAHRDIRTENVMKRLNIYDAFNVIAKIMSENYKNIYSK